MGKWVLIHEEIEARKYNLKAINNNAPDFTHKRKPPELYNVIWDTQREVEKELAELMKQ